MRLQLCVQGQVALDLLQTVQSDRRTLKLGVLSQQVVQLTRGCEAATG